MLSLKETDLDESLLSERLQTAFARRQPFFSANDAYRMVHGEADLLPGLIVDRYGDTAVLQSTTRAMDAREPLIAELVAAQLGCRMVVARNDGSARDLEGLPRRKSVLRGQGATLVQYSDSGNRFEVDVLSDGKTGGFLDQLENHDRARGYATSANTALDVFTYHGGFALALARGGATSVLAIDESPAAVARVRENSQRNHFSQVEVEIANAFDRLRALEAEGRYFDLVVLDPPALAKRKTGPRVAERAYKELNLRGLRLVRPGGILITCSCSGKMTVQYFGQMLEAAARDVGRPVQVLERCGAGRDHPVLLGVPETDYLKCWFLRVL
jgi:23S rRNA (cytosine1962-C5)-methyltransferase